MSFNTKPMTKQEVAEWILDILVNDLRLNPGDEVPDHQLKEKYRARNGDSANIPAGLEYADEQGWLTYDPVKSTWLLTETGCESTGSGLQ